MKVNFGLFFQQWVFFRKTLLERKKSTFDNCTSWGGEYFF